MENDLISRSALWTDIMMLPHNGDIISSEEVEQTVVEAPAVDAVEVVRCKDCKNSFIDDFDGSLWCCRDVEREVVDNHFCSYGERRADDGN